MPIFTNFSVNSELMTVQEKLKSTYWNMENGYFYDKNHKEDQLYPRRIFSMGSRQDLRLELTDFIDESQKDCLNYAEGLRFTLHSPDDLPRLSDDFFYIPLKRSVHVSVKPNVIITSNGTGSW